MEEDQGLQVGKDELPELENLDLQDEAVLEELEAEEAAQQPEQQQNEQPLPASMIKKPRKPLTPYLLFIQRQKQTLMPGEKFSIKAASQTWKILTSQEKATYMDMYTEQKRVYDDYVKACAERGMDIEKEEELDFFFPSSRIRAIMRQSPGINVKGETLLTMSKAVEYFGEHVLSVVARNSTGKKKIEASDLWEAINTDRMLWFLRPLVDQWNKDHELGSRPAKPEKQRPPRIVLEKQPENAGDFVEKPLPASSARKKTPSKPQPPGKHQMKLTDMYPITK